MLISHKYKFIMIHIQKTAGTSLVFALKEADSLCQDNISTSRKFYRPGKAKHITSRVLREYIHDATWNDYFKFSFVRNPWDRLVSWYAMCKKMKPNSIYMNPFVRYVKGLGSFSEFIVKTYHPLMPLTITNQVDYLVDDKDKIQVDFIGRYEQLSKGIEYIKKKVGVDLFLPHLNKSDRDKYRAYYTDETRKIVEEKFAKDIEYFKYEF